MLLDGLRSRETLDLRLEDLQLAEVQIHVSGNISLPALQHLMPPESKGVSTMQSPPLSALCNIPQAMAVKCLMP